MPVDMMRICLTSSPPLCPFLNNCGNRQSSSATVLLPHRPCLVSAHCSNTNSSNFATPSTASATTTAESGRSQTWLQTKKTVVFADSRGLALTAVHVFDKSDDDPLTELQFQLSEEDGMAARLLLGDITDAGGSDIVLDFIQPGVDYLELRNRLKTQQVCLDTCSVQERLLSGTVQVQNLCFEKLVSVRITFDSWHTFQDFPCQYLNKVYGCPDIDIFTFSIALPAVLKLPDEMEFCIQYQTEDKTYWDNNCGNNYRLTVVYPSARGNSDAAGVESHKRCEASKMQEMVFDHFGSPRTSVGIFPVWQSWGQLETGALYW
ncbi:protein phosphatase 1 regulatory subunit 3C-B-like [Thalassophryne amazonica]|uniref:protein phosphatase 1 regulatory subunit 3C-B-like n=1 Tax=Thalassophryne amazonica TaxID=390379 RepID=UPI0014726365|nr:protein phosphatase 1 regulatory subunit 3C-B-like [Thalassophryne amazonica]XP_034049110.1 protein phosphatase 1 regulatory subunit 3C-B-like [Thalassophryne amazonica]